MMYGAKGAKRPMSKKMDSKMTALRKKTGKRYSKKKATKAYG
tara:strand:- start:279 stop:404 length:126 start_codon:yes stop_codon:yes gene_type:complete